MPNVHIASHANFMFLYNLFVFCFCSKSEFVIYKLKQMGKISENDISQIGRQFDSLDSSQCGKLTLADLMETA